MNFVHDEPGFASLLTQVADQIRIAPALVEKDYWITHALWALHETGLDLWFKGGTSLSKGFGLIERFSEDLDLMVERGRVTALPDVSSWSSLNKGPVAQRQAYDRALGGRRDREGARRARVRDPRAAMEKPPAIARAACREQTRRP
jgi:hypothetical protein